MSVHHFNHEIHHRVLNWFSPKTASGSILLAALVHGAIYGGVLLFLGLGFLKHEESIRTTDEIAYETFSEPPAPATIQKPIARQPDPEEPRVVDKLPDLAARELQDDKSDIAGTQAASKPVTQVGSEGTGDATAVPFYKIKPKYPRAALVSGVEGWILLKIDVNEKGEVENVRVAGGQERSMFQDEARRAVEKWKYKPFLNAQGQPTKKTNHEVRVDFKLQDAA